MEPNKAQIDTLTGKQVLEVRAWLYAFMMGYIAIVCINAGSLVILFWLRAVGIVPVPYEVLAA